MGSVTTTDETTTAPQPEPETKPDPAEPTIIEAIPSLTAPDPKTESPNVPRQGSGDDWWARVYNDQDADLDTHTGTPKTPLTRHLPAPTSPEEGGDPEGEGSETGEADPADDTATGPEPEPRKIPPRPTRPPRMPAPPAKEPDPEPENKDGDEAARDQINALLKTAVKDALDERAEEEGEGEPAPTGRWGKIRSKVPRKEPSRPAPPAAPPFPGGSGNGSGSGSGNGRDSWARGLRARRLWGLRYAPAVGGFFYFDLGSSVTPFLASSVVDPAGMVGSLLAFSTGPAAWWLSRGAKGKAYATRIRAVFACGVSGLAYTWGGPSATSWLYAHGVDPSMWVPFGAGALTAIALWRFLDRCTYRWPWLFGWIPLIPSTAVALATATYVINF